MQNTEKLRQFRQKIYQNFNKRADTVLNLLDSLSSNENASSVVELSLNPAFERSYTALYKAIDELELAPSLLAQATSAHLPKPSQWPFWLLAVDVTSYPRQFSRTLEDRSVVYQPNQIKGNNPITFGHRYSTVSLIPPKDSTGHPWAIPLATDRVASDEDKELTGAAQINQLMQDESMPFYNQLSVEVGDTSYSKPAYLVENRHHTNLVTIARLRSNRVLYHSPEVNNTPAGPGHPTWYGDRFGLNDADSWSEPSMSASTTQTTHRGKVYQVEIKAWTQMLMRGKRKPKVIPMHQHPFTLVQIRWLDADGNFLFKKPIWLTVIGERRETLDLLDIYQAYLHRSNLEHFFRFAKQKLLLIAYQTIDVEREENWWQLVHLAYAQLWVARSLAKKLPRPWEKHLPQMKETELSPTLVQRDFGRIIRQTGSPAVSPKRRGYSPGRKLGMKLDPRPRQNIQYAA